MFQQAMGEHRQTLARRVLHLRKAKGWSQERLAREADLSDKTISRIEQAKEIETSATTYDKLAAALSVPVTDLDAGRPTLEELEAQDGPLERIEKALNELGDAFSQRGGAHSPSSELTDLRAEVQDIRSTLDDLLAALGVSALAGDETSPARKRSRRTAPTGPESQKTG